ncbi:hypothetical protein [Sphingobium sp. WCS2017Hpa-17]|uniref:hypothetical protein n=1 Tax=Sphingobium sp. WCS2017Hpa-17 TaxID=3073638 RepID=UPI00288BE05D|nr:hypothetical protein [Sphingobium sp. WCS2017Hpa-17]
MPATEPAARHDAALVSAYDRYAALARKRELLCADPLTTESQRFDAAMAVHKAFQDFLTTNAKPMADGE